MSRALRAALEPLPDEATVPVRWIREKLEEDADQIEIDLTAEEAGKLLGRSGSTVARWCREGKFRAYQLCHPAPDARPRRAGVPVHGRRGDGARRAGAREAGLRAPGPRQAPLRGRGVHPAAGGCHRPVGSI